MLDLTKPVQTMDDRPVTLITTSGRGRWPLIGYIGDDVIPNAWHSDGVWDRDMVINNKRNLINVSEPKRSGEVELMVYEELYHPHKGAITTYAVPVGKEQNNDKSMKLIHKSGPYKWTEGEGLEGE